MSAAAWIPLAMHTVFHPERKEEEMDRSEFEDDANRWSPPSWERRIRKPCARCMRIRRLILELLMIIVPALTVGLGFGMVGSWLWG